MSDVDHDLGICINALAEDRPAFDWNVATPDGYVLLRCSSHDDAMNMRARVVRLSRADILGLTISASPITPKYMDRTGLVSADSRFCDWALSRLGQVTVHTSLKDTEPRFVVENEGGKRGEGRTLAAALFGLVQTCSMTKNASSMPQEQNAIR